MRCEKLPFTNADHLLISSFEDDFDSFEAMLQSEEHFYSPLLMSQAVNELCGLKNLLLHKTGKNPQTPQDAEAIFSAGMAFGSAYELKGNGLILAQTPLPQLAQHKIKALQETPFLENFELLSSCDARTLFCAGFLLEASRRFHVVVSGEIEMALVLLVADLLRGAVLMRAVHANITFATTDISKDIEDLLKNLSYTPQTVVCNIDLRTSTLGVIQQLMKKQQNASGAAAAMLAYAATNAIEESAIIEQLELLHYLR